MDISALLTDAFTRIRHEVREVADGLDVEALVYRPDRDANSIAWLLWHATRVHDDHVADLAGREQAWTSEGWADRFSLPLDVRDTGYGHTSQQVGSVRVEDPELLVGYHDAVAARTFDYLATLDASALDRIVDKRWDPPVSVGVRLVSVMNDQMQHVGQAAYVRGLWERRSPA